DGARSAGRTVRPGTRAAAGKREEPGGCLSSRRTLAAPVRSLPIAPGARRPGSLLLLSRPQRLRPHRRSAAEVASTGTAVNGPGAPRRNLRRNDRGAQTRYPAGPVRDRFLHDGDLCPRLRHCAVTRAGICGAASLAAGELERQCRPRSTFAPGARLVAAADRLRNST